MAKLNIMKFLKSFRSKANLKSKERDSYRNHDLPTPPFSPPGKDYIGELPPKILELIFQFVCPHAADESYESCEESSLHGACMLCDLRDLSHCVKVSKRWRKLATGVL